MNRKMNGRPLDEANSPHRNFIDLNKSVATYYDSHLSLRRSQVKEIQQLKNEEVSQRRQQIESENRKKHYFQLFRWDFLRKHREDLQV